MSTESQHCRGLGPLMVGTGIALLCTASPGMGADDKPAQRDQDRAAAVDRAETRRLAQAPQTKRTRKVVFTEGVVHRVETFKTVGDVSLNVHIYERENRDRDRPVPAIVFFFGGGWMSGSPGQFYHHADYLASRGMVAMSAEYRVRKRHGTTPFECVTDGKSAIRWIRQHADRLGIDPDRVAAGGGSAGGHVAAAIATIAGLDEKGEDTAVRALPNALVLFNPVIDTTMDGYQSGAKRLGERAAALSPCHHVKEGLPPTLIFHGTQDSTVPFENVERFQKLMKNAGNRCEVMAFEGKGHGFFNWMRDPDNASYEATIRRMDAFLTELGWLQPR